MAGGNDSDSGDDADLFRQAMKSLGVSRVHYPPTGADGKPAAARQVRPRGAGPPASRTGRTAAPVAVDRTDMDQAILFVRAGIPPARVKQLRRGRLAIEESLDLHGLRGAEAEPALERFINECLEADLRTVLLIHGKGRGSEVTGGVLKPLAVNWLKQQPDILAFCEAQPHDGGGGALYVLLGSRPDNRPEPVTAWK